MVKRLFRTPLLPLIAALAACAVVSATAQKRIWETVESNYFKVAGPTAERTFTLPNANATILTDNAAVTVSQGGTGAAPGGDDQVLVSSSSSAATWKTINDCQGTGKALTYTQSTNAWGCNTYISDPWTYATVSGSDAQTTNQTLTDVTGLTFAATANHTYEFEAVLFCTTTAVTTGTKYGVQFSAAGAAAYTNYEGAITSTTGGDSSTNALNTADATAFLTTSAQSGVILIKGIFTTGGNAGNFTIQHLKVTSGTSTVKIGSVLKVRLIV